MSNEKRIKRVREAWISYSFLARRQPHMGPQLGEEHIY